MEKDVIKASLVIYVHTETNQSELLDLATGKYTSTIEDEKL